MVRNSLLKKIVGCIASMVLCITEASAIEAEEQETVEILSLDVLSYDSFVREEPETLDLLRKALFEKGIVGIRGVPGYKDKVTRLIENARQFSSLPEEVKEIYGPDRSLGEVDLGYEKGKEKFQRLDGTWVVDSLKTTYSAFVPDVSINKWSKEVDLQTPFLELGTLMSDMGEAVMEKIGLIGPNTGISLDGIPRKGRLLYYQSIGEKTTNPLWCGAHFDHGPFTVLLPSFYFAHGKAIAEPAEAGLFIKTTRDGMFKKIVADDPDVLLFQVGEFGQLMTDDAIRATEHRVHKAHGPVERYTMALFLNAPRDTVVHSFSELTNDSRYGGIAGAPCSFGQWQERSFNRYLVIEETEKTVDD